MNLLSLVTPWLDNVYQIKTKCYSTQKQKNLRTKQGRRWCFCLRMKSDEIILFPSFRLRWSYDLSALLKIAMSTLYRPGCCHDLRLLSCVHYACNKCIGIAREFVVTTPYVIGHAGAVSCLFNMYRELTERTSLPHLILQALVLRSYL
jgi:hypothetical protein